MAFICDDIPLIYNDIIIRLEKFYKIITKMLRKSLMFRKKYIPLHRSHKTVTK